VLHLCSWCLSGGSSSSPLSLCSMEMARAGASSIHGTAGTRGSLPTAEPAADGANPTTRGEEEEHTAKAGEAERELCQQPGRASTQLQARRGINHRIIKVGKDLYDHQAQPSDPRCPPTAVPCAQPKHTKAPEEPQREKSQFRFDSFNWGCLFVYSSGSYLEIP